MLFSIVLFFLTLFSSIGFGSLLARGLGSKESLSRVFFFNSCIYGLFFSGLIANLFNFFFPLNTEFTYGFLFVGLLLFFIFWRSGIVETFRSQTLYIGVFVLVSILFIGYSLDNNTIEDSGLYHIQLIKWMKEDRVVLGLANLHDRFGFNSLWLSICAILTPVVDQNHYVDICLTVLLMSMLGLLSSEYLQKKSKVAGLIVLVLLVLWGKDQIFQGLGSPANDSPSAILFILAIWNLYKSDRDSLLNVLVICVFSVLVKLSQVGLAIAFAVALVRLFNLDKKSLLRPLLFFALAVTLWSGRGVLLSGCIAYPMESTCFRQLKWTPLTSETEEARLWIKSWARQEQVHYSEVLKDNRWMQSWVSRNIQKTRVLFAVVFLVLGAGLFIYRRKRFEMAQETLLFVVCAISLIPWFILAPDVRFASGSFICISALCLAMIKYPRLPSRVAKPVMGVFILITMVFVMDLIRICKSAWVNHPIIKTYAGQELGAIRSEVNPQGVFYYFPDIGNDKCWLAPLPCAPYSRPSLRMTTTNGYKSYCTQCGGDDNVIQ